MSTSPIGIGCLGLAHPHCSVRLDVARRMEEFHLVGVAERDPDLADNLTALASHVGAPALSLTDLLSSPDLDAVIIESWTTDMVDDALACIAAGKHVLVEKPAGLNTHDLRRLVDASSDAGVVVQVGYNFRFSPAVDFAARALREGLLGQVTQVRVHAAGPAGDAHYRWYNLPGDVGGTFWEDGCHIVDLIVALFGVPANATAVVSKYPTVSGSDSREDTAVAALEYDDMVVAFDFTAWEANDWIETWQFSVYGTLGTLTFRLVPCEFELYLKSASGEFRKGWNRWSETTFAVPWAGEPQPWDEWHVVENTSFFVRELSAFASAIREGGPSPIPVSQAYNIAAVMEACFTSSADGRTRVPIDAV